MSSRRSFVTLLLALSGPLPALALAGNPEDNAGLSDYLSRPDPSFAWKEIESVEYPQGTANLFQFTSQTWRNIPWSHQLQVYTPKQVTSPSAVLLFITGGSSKSGKPGANQAAQYFAIAEACGARVAVLPQVPNQPLLGDRYEDDLIAETFTQYLKTGEADWPLLFPMVKSAVRAMDAVQHWAEGGGKPVESFIVTGASKRGWTTWLTGASDPRVIGIAPMVIPTLNMRAQTAHQREVFGGKYSEEIADYSSRGLTEVFGKPEGEALTRLIDPYFYLGQIKVPVLQLNGTNDPYWTTDSMNLFWDDIHAPKYVSYIPNAGHGLDKSELVGPYAINTLGAFFRNTASGRGMPKLDWEYRDEPGHSPSLNLKIGVTDGDAFKGITLWVADAPTQDFRESRWSPSEIKAPMEVNGGSVQFKIDLARPESGYRALLADLTFDQDGLVYHLSTQIKILGPKPVVDK